MQHPIQTWPVSPDDQRTPRVGLIDRIFCRSPRPTALLEEHLREFVRLDELLVAAQRALSEPALRSADIFEEIVAGLAAARTHGGVAGWAAAVRNVRSHRLLTLMHQEDLMRRAFHAPAGRADDVVRMAGMDDPEAVERPGEALTELGVRLRGWLIGSPLTQSLLNRTAILAHAIDAAATATPHGAEVLALACGNLSEARLSRAVRAGELRRFVALDHDFQAVETAARAFGRHTRVNAIHTPTYALLNGGSSAFGRFDLIYSAALFERFNQGTAAQAIASMYGMLKPSGRILIANLAPTLPETGLIEAVMNWWPIYRDRTKMEDLGAAAAQSLGAATRVTLEPADNIYFLEVARPA